MINNNDIKNPVIAKYIANSGICSRRKVLELLEQGLVTVNGQVLKDPTYRVADTDKVVVDGQGIKQVRRKVYILLNKPKDYITTVSDESGRRTVMDLISEVRERVYPIGRLDRHTTGLLLLTNDGALADRLSHPRYEIEKVYQVTLDKPVQRDHLIMLVQEGVMLEDGVARVDTVRHVPKSRYYQVKVTIHSGKNRIIRRIFEALGYQVMALDRVLFAGLTKQGLRPGNWRFLSQAEIAALRGN